MKEINYAYYGGSINTSTLQKMLQNSYSKTLDDEIDDYLLDKELSGKRVQVRYNHSKSYVEIVWKTYHPTNI